MYIGFTYDDYSLPVFSDLVVANSLTPVFEPYGSMPLNIADTHDHSREKLEALTQIHKTKLTNQQLIQKGKNFIQSQLIKAF